MILFPDPIETLIGYLINQPELEDVAVSQDPRPHDYEGLYVQVRDAGGNGVWQHFFCDANVYFEVSHEDSVEASRAVRWLEALLIAWGGKQGFWLQTVNRPYFNPDPDLRLPAYSMTQVFRFRGVDAGVQH